MAVSVGTVYVDVKPNMQGFTTALSKGVAPTSSFGSKIKTLGATALKVGGVGFTALAAGATAAFHAFEESEQVSKQTAAVIKSTGGAAAISAKGVADMASRLSALSGQDDEAIQQGENLLLTFTNIRNEVDGKFTGTFDRATKTLLDLSTAMGSEPKAAAVQLGKALNDPIKGITALTRVGVTFTKQQEKQIAEMVKAGDVAGAQGVILDELDKEFGGSAEAQATATGKMSVAFGNLAETVGGLLAPVLGPLFESLAAGATTISQNLGPALATLGKWFASVWKKAQPFVKAFADAVVPALQATWNQIKRNLIPALAQLWRGLQPIVKVIGVLVAVALAGLIKALPLVVKLLSVVVTILAKAWQTIAKVVDWISKLVGWLVEHLSPAFQDLKDILTGLWDGVLSVGKQALNFIIEGVNKIITGMNVAIDLLDKAAGPFINFGEIPHIPALASGGIVTQPTLALIGESGPEAVVPLSGRGGGGPMTLRILDWRNGIAQLDAELSRTDLF